ncbi:MAG: ATP-dependent DNA helicase, partial [Janthinobacterium lividum]
MTAQTRAADAVPGEDAVGTAAVTRASDARPSAARVAELASLFDTRGPLARNIPGYRPRESQLRMALAVAATIAASMPADNGRFALRQTGAPAEDA